MPARDRELRYRLTSDSRGLRRGIGQAERELQGLERTTGRTSRRVIGSMARMAGAAGIGAVGVGLAAAAKSGISFEKEMSNVRAATRASGREMRQLTELANRMGAETKFSSAEAASAMTALVKGGLSVKQVMGGGMKTALSLAAAGELELAEAAQVTVNAMNQFGLKGRQAAVVADGLAIAADATTADVTDFGMALSQSGNAAQLAGLTFQETVVYLQALAEAGVKNSDAGTSLKTSLLQLVNPSKKQAALAKELGLSFIDAEGNMKSADEMAAMLNDRLGDMDRAQRTAVLATLAGTDGVRTLAAVYAMGEEKLQGFEKGLNRSGYATDVAKIKQDNVAGAFEQLTGSIETAGIALYSNFQGPMKDVMDDVTGWVNEASADLNDFFETLAQDPEFQAADFGKKFELIVAELERRGVPDKIANAIADGVVGGLEFAIKATATIAPKMAAAFVEAFVEAPVWARALGTAWLLRKLGGRRRAAAAGAAMGSSFAGGFAGTAGPAGAGGVAGGALAGGVAGGAAGAARRRGPDRVTIANRQRGAGWEQWRSGAPVSQIAGGAVAGGVIGRGLGRLRGAGAAGRAMLGGPAGIAIGTAVIVLPEVAKTLGQARTEGFNLPRQPRFLGMRRERGHLERFLGFGSDPRVERFAERGLRRDGRNVEGELAFAAKTGNVRALRALRQEAERLAKESPKARKELTAFARAADSELGKIKNHRRFRREIQEMDRSIGDLSKSPYISLKNLRSRIRINAEQIAKDIGTHTQEGKDLMGKNIGAGIRVVQRGMKNGEISTKEGMREIRRLIKVDTGASKDIVATNFSAMRDALRDQVRRGVGDTRKAMSDIRRITAQNLRLYNVSESAIDRHLQVESRGVLGGHGKHRGAKAQGGWIGSPGERGRDAVPAMLGRGEFVANAHQQRHIEEALAVSQALGVGRFGSLDSLAGSVQTPHYLAKGGFVQGASARGLTASALALAHKLFSRGFNVTSAFRSTSNTFHGRGGALDFGDSVNDMRRLGSVLIPKRSQFAELFGPGGSWKYGKRIPQVPNHMDHWHVAVTGGVGGLGGGAPRIRRVKVRGDRGAMTAIAQGAVDRTRRAAQKYLDEKIMEAPTGAHGTGQAAGNRQVRQWAAQALRHVGWYSPANLNALVSRIMQESGGNPRAVNNWDINAKRGDPSKGLAQTIGATFARYRDKRLPNNVFHPLANLVAALRYMKARYGRVVGANGQGYQSGGRVGKVASALKVSQAKARQLLRRALKPADLRRLNITETKARELGLRLDPISFRYQTYSTAMRRAGEGAEVIERASDRVGFLERQHGLTEEDLMLPSGREERLTELGAITTAQQEITKTREVQFGRLNNASVAARKALNAARALDRRLLKEIRAAKEGSKERKRLVARREQVRQRMRRLEGHRKEALTAREEAERALRDARLDVDETAKAIAEVNSPVNVAQGQLELVELQEAAGNLSAAQAFQLRYAARQAAMDSGKLGQRDYLTLYAAQREDIASQRVDPLQAVSDRLAEIDLHLRAGDYGQDAAAERTAQAERERALRETLGRTDLTARESLQLRADLQDVSKEIAADRQAREENTQAVKDMTATHKQMLAYADKAQSVEIGVLRRAIADIASGELASNYGHRARAAGNGRVAR